MTRSRGTLDKWVLKLFGSPMTSDEVQERIRLFLCLVSFIFPSYKAADIYFSLNLQFYVFYLWPYPVFMHAVVPLKI